MSERVEFAMVPDSWASEQERKLARAVSGLAARQLGLPAPRVVWVQPSWEAGYTPMEEDTFRTVDDFNGMVRRKHPGTIFLRTGLTMKQLLKTTAHEVRHLQQAEQGGGWETWWRNQRRDHHRAEQEADAEEWARRFAMELGW